MKNLISKKWFIPLAAALVVVIAGVVLAITLTNKNKSNADNEGNNAQEYDVVTQNTPTFVANSDAPSDMKIALYADNLSMDEVLKGVVLTSLSDGNSEVELEGEYVDNEYRVCPDGGFVPGNTYRLHVVSPDVRIVYNGEIQDESVDYYNLVIHKDEVCNVKVSENVSDICVNDLNGFSITPGLYTIKMGDDGSIEQNELSGSFTTDKIKYNVGDVVAVYDGAFSENGVESGEVQYIKITGVNGNNYTWETPDAFEILDFPDIIPVFANQKHESGKVVVDRNSMDFSDGKYAEMGLDENTTLDVDDIVVIAVGSDDESVVSEYGKVTSVNEQNNKITIEYTTMTEAEVKASMDLYQTNPVNLNPTEEQIARACESIERAAYENGMAEDLAEDVIHLVLDEDTDKLPKEIKEMTLLASNGDKLPLEDVQEVAKSAKKVEVEDPKIEAYISKNLEHFESSDGIRVELRGSVTVKIKLNEDNIIEIKAVAVFEEESIIGINIKGGAEWRKKWGVFPYIYDYTVDVNFDAGIFVGVTVQATFQTKEDEEDPSEDQAKSTLDKIKKDGLTSIGLEESVNLIKYTKEEVIGESEAAAGGSLADKYSDMIDGDADWIDLVEVEIFEAEGSPDPLHIICFGAKGSFVLQGKLNASIGASAGFGAAKRYNFHLSIKHKDITHGEVDLETPNFNFDFYVFGQIGVRVGLKLELKVGLISTKIDSIGIEATAGVYAQAFGYFYYNFNWEYGKGTESGYQGSFLFEVGIFTDINFVAQVLDGKLKAEKEIYSEEWPLWNIGCEAIAQDFVGEQLDTRETIELEAKSKQPVYKLPEEFLTMQLMDIKTGEIGEKSFDTDTDSKFEFTFTNDNFAYDPVSNTVYYKISKENKPEKTELTIKWKGQQFALNSKTLVRKFKFEWKGGELTEITFDELPGGVQLDPVIGYGGMPFIGIDLPELEDADGLTFVCWYEKDENDEAKYWDEMPEFFPEEDTVLYPLMVPSGPTITYHYLLINPLSKGYKEITTEAVQAHSEASIESIGEEARKFLKKDNDRILLLENCNEIKDAVFSGWYDESILDYLESKTDVPSASIMGKAYKALMEGTENVDLYGAFFSQYQVYFDMGEPAKLAGVTGLKYNDDFEIHAMEPFLSNVEFTLPKLPEYEGYTFLYWKGLNGGPDIYPWDGSSYSFEATESCDYMYKAIWEKDDVEVNLFFNNPDVYITDSDVEGLAADGYKLSGILKYNDVISLPNLGVGEMTKHVGWFYDPDCTQPVENSNSFKLNSNEVTLYAGWQPSAVRVETFIKVLGSNDYTKGETSLFAITPFSKTTIKDCIAKDLGKLYTVDKVTLNSQEADLDSIVDEETGVTVTVYCAEIPYTITFVDGLTGNIYSSVTCKYGETVQYPSVSKDGYNFVGWTIDNAPAPKDKITVDGNRKYTANWKLVPSKPAKKTYTIKFYEAIEDYEVPGYQNRTIYITQNVGEPFVLTYPFEQTLPYTPVNAKNDAVEEGGFYYFGNTYCDIAAPGETIELRINHVFYNEVSYHMSFYKPDGNGGWDWISSFWVIKGYESLRSIPSLENYENEGYEFIGWSTKENDITVEYAVGDTPPEPSESYNGSLKLYPVWVAK